MKNPLRLKSVNHISIVCNSVEKSVDFYQKVLGFCPVKRPASFNFHGAWLFNYGIGIHLLQSDDPESMPKKRSINPKDNHLSFQSENMGTVEKQLKEMRIEYVKCEVEDDGILVDQLFFHDPDGLMIEICNCEDLPILPLSSAAATTPRLCSIQQAEQRQKLHQIQKRRRSNDAAPTATHQHPMQRMHVRNSTWKKKRGD